MKTSTTGTTGTADSKTSAAEPGSAVVRPRNPWLRLLVVVGAISLTGSLTFLVVGVARLLGVDPKGLQGPRSVVSPTTVTIFLTYLALLTLVVFAFQRYVHRRPFSALGFRAPVLKHLVIGFAAGLVATGTAPLAGLITGSLTAQWNVPPEVSAFTLLGYYCVFFFVLLTGNSFGEELAYRCYPIEQLRDRPALMMAAIMVSALAFAGVHFVIGEFSLGRFLIMTCVAWLYSYLYVYYRSIWLLIGLHNGLNFTGMTLGGNWKMGGLITLSGESASSLPALLGLLAPILVMVLFYRFRPRPGLGSEVGRPQSG